MTEMELEPEKRGKIHGEMKLNTFSFFLRWYILLFLNTQQMRLKSHPKPNKENKSRIES